MRNTTMNENIIIRAIDAKTAWQEREQRFLAAWKRGVTLAGEACFKVTAESVGAATSREQLRPDWDYIEAHLLDRSNGEAAFLATLCSFFNSEWGQVLLDRAGYPNLCDLASKLDPGSAEIIAELFVSYHGW